MTWSFPVGRILGTEVRVHATFFLLLLWIGVAGFLEGGSRDAIVSLLFILALFACVVLHEFGHALMARRYGISTPDITLLPIGGMARLERMPEKPAQEIAVALAGPAVNVAIWGSGRSSCSSSGRRPTFSPSPNSRTRPRASGRGLRP